MSDLSDSDWECDGECEDPASPRMVFLSRMGRPAALRRVPGDHLGAI
jgi:hypothetical protein